MLKYFILNDRFYTTLPESVLDGISVVGSVVVSVVGSKWRSVEELVISGDVCQKNFIIYNLFR